MRAPRICLFGGGERGGGEHGGCFFVESVFCLVCASVSVKC